MIAVLMNAHYQTNGVPWTEDDVMGLTDRDKRQKQQVVAKLNSNLRARKVTPGNPDDERTVPGWALEAAQAARTRVN